MQKIVLSNFFKNRIYLKEFIGSFLISMLILSQNFFGISEMLFGTTLPFKVLLVLGAFIGFFYFDKHFNIKQFAIFFIVITFFGITYILNKTTSLSNLALAFLVYGCLAFIISFCNFHELWLYRFCVFFGFIWLALYLLVNKMSINSTFLFGYKVLPIFLVTFLLLTYKTKSKVVLIFRILLFSIAAFFLVTSGSRGPVFCGIVFIFIHYLPALKKWKTAIIYLSVLTVFIVLLINIVPIVTWIYNMFPNKLSFIDKTYSLIVSEKGISNGRFEIFAHIFKEYRFVDFITGSGVGEYSATHPAEDYTHNLFISAALDFGIIGVLFVAYVIVLFVFNLLINDEHHRYLELLFTLSVVTLFFSMNYWKLFTFWLLIFYMLWYCKSIRSSIDLLKMERKTLCLQ